MTGRGCLQRCLKLIPVRKRCQVTNSVSEILHTNTKTLTLNTNKVTYSNNTNTNNTKLATTDYKPVDSLGNSVSVIKNNNLSVEQVRGVASKLCDKLANPSRFEFYCKVAWHTPEHIIWANLEQALRGNNPINYFSFLSKLTLKQKGIA